MSVLRKTNFGKRKSSDGGDIATDFITAAQITNQTQKDAVNYLQQALIDSGIWDVCLAVYPIVGGNANSHKYNLKDPRDLDAAFRISWSGGTHNALGSLDAGYTFISPNMMPQNDVHLSFYSMSDIAGGNWIDIGTTTSSGSNFHLSIDWSTLGNLSRLNSSYESNSYNPANTFGLGAISRLAANEMTLWDKATKIKTSTKASTTPSNNIIAVGGAQYFTGRICGFASIGYALTDAENVILNDIVNNYQDILGRNPLQE